MFDLPAAQVTPERLAALYAGDHESGHHAPVAEAHGATPPFATA
jgi:hypothetical protein